MSMLDTTIVNVALRTLGQDLHAGLSTIQWVVTGYLLALAVVIPTTGWAVDRFGAKRLFVAATGLFVASSALCAVAWNVGSLAPQGLGTALAMPIAGIFTDRIGARRVVLAGMALITAGTIVLTQVSASTSYWVFAATLVVRGLGFGATMMSAMAAGYRNLPAAAAGHASTVLQIFSRVGGMLGAALMAVILARQILTKTTAGRGASTDLSAAYGAIFWWATAITAAGVLFALLLPGKADGPGRQSGQGDGRMRCPPRKRLELRGPRGHSQVP